MTVSCGWLRVTGHGCGAEGIRREDARTSYQLLHDNGDLIRNRKARPAHMWRRVSARQHNTHFSAIEQTIICSFPCYSRDISGLCFLLLPFLTGYISLVEALQRLKLEYHGNTPLERWKQQVPSKRQLSDIVSPSGLS